MPTRIDVVADPVRDRCLLTTDHLSPRPLPGRAGVVRVALVAAGALLLAGDEVRIEVSVKGPVRLEIVETAGTVAYGMNGGSARWDVDLRLTDGASLHWYAEPFIVSADADVTRCTTAYLEPGCTAELRESLILGRHNEVGGSLRTSTRAWIDDQQVLAEDLDLSAAARTSWAVLGEARCLDSITTLGFRLPHDPHTLQLEAAGSITRRLVDEHHESDLSPGIQSGATQNSLP
ncbi:urease accessory protein UreD [Kribbella shirazensis]|uniref:Urease accessory protein n=1 Tax=Kribbella shirazensis TaxID=1105143 RepID=A0A7X5VC15_9ACTN|nr:urease accessory protein UreD [Kribbella shirazensis]NIK58455.1 urease accessory protein [Kribbella shirazensis]